MFLCAPATGRWGAVEGGGAVKGGGALSLVPDPAFALARAPITVSGRPCAVAAAVAAEAPVAVSACWMVDGGGGGREESRASWAGGMLCSTLIRMRAVGSATPSIQIAKERIQSKLKICRRTKCFFKDTVGRVHLHSQSENKYTNKKIQD